MPVVRARVLQARAQVPQEARAEGALRRLRCGLLPQGTFLTQRVCKAFLRKSIPVQIRQLILCIRDNGGQVDRFVGELTLASAARSTRARSSAAPSSRASAPRHLPHTIKAVLHKSIPVQIRLLFISVVIKDKLTDLWRN